MRESTSHKIVRVYTRKELAEALGFVVLPGTKIIIEVHNEDVTVCQQDDTPSLASAQARLPGRCK